MIKRAIEAALAAGVSTEQVAGQLLMHLIDSERDDSRLEHWLTHMPRSPVRSHAEASSCQDCLLCSSASGDDDPVCLHPETEYRTTFGMSRSPEWCPLRAAPITVTLVEESVEK